MTVGSRKWFNIGDSTPARVRCRITPIRCTYTSPGTPGIALGASMSLPSRMCAKQPRSPRSRLVFGYWRWPYSRSTCTWSSASVPTSESAISSDRRNPDQLFSPIDALLGSWNGPVVRTSRRSTEMTWVDTSATWRHNTRDTRIGFLERVLTDPRRKPGVNPRSGAAAPRSVSRYSGALGFSDTRGVAGSFGHSGCRRVSRIPRAVARGQLGPWHHSTRKGVNWPPAKAGGGLGLAPGVR